MGQSRPLLGLFSSFSHSDINYNFNNTNWKQSIEGVLGIRSRAAGLVAQTKLAAMAASQLFTFCFSFPHFTVDHSLYLSPCHSRSLSLSFHSQYVLLSFSLSLSLSICSSFFLSLSLSLSICCSFFLSLSLCLSHSLFFSLCLSSHSRMFIVTPKTCSVQTQKNSSSKPIELV